MIVNTDGRMNTKAKMIDTIIVETAVEFPVLSSPARKVRIEKSKHA